MKIKVFENHVAVLNHGKEVVGLFKSIEDAVPVIERAVKEHFDCKDVIVSPALSDFAQPLDFEQSFTAAVYHSEGEIAYITLVLTFAPVYS